MLVDTGRVVVTRNVTWAHVPSGRFPAAQSKPSEEGEGDESDHEEASLEGSESASGHEESEPSESEDEIESSMTDTVTSGRAPIPESGAESDKGGVSYDPEGMMPSGEGLAKA